MKVSRGDIVIINHPFSDSTGAKVRPSLVVGDAELLLTLEGDRPKICFEDWMIALPIEEAGPVAELAHDTPMQIAVDSVVHGRPVPVGLRWLFGSVPTLERLLHAVQEVFADASVTIA